MSDQDYYQKKPFPNQPDFTTKCQCLDWSGIVHAIHKDHPLSSTYAFACVCPAGERFNYPKWTNAKLNEYEIWKRK